ncbi:ubiquitin C-terminal hydrolase-like protein [Dothidotthia symphoricarpi CBS 119687]|uniref:ubiquitinyl hydrolase 1 n=1 Tax=Dothidotthia symphoricarpi CBS 119687 TaxID=1392245 RepID=A0A6A6AFR6_9PLEO|nr:ubiquitin C-terminal hydrolase-like protein [Dothidotthia symphoricarpi CBS 119687]KAF2130143.1 ubiquitin C-terminal hydrolase-like protein [Dothidotthia symphoricarpi CBS 119687]
MAPGKTAPRLLQDLLTYDARFEERAGRNLLTSAPPQHDPNRPAQPAVPQRNCRHGLLNKIEQCQLPRAGEDPDQTTVYKVASYCSSCRWHIDVVVDFSSVDGSKTRPCKTGDHEYPIHHFLLEEEDVSHATNGSGLQQGSQMFKFRCSAPECPVNVQIKMKPPRLSDSDVELLTNQAQLRRRLEVAQQMSADRTDMKMARRVDAPDFLNTYLGDSLNPVRGKSRIPLLNRKFLTAFGRDCDAILKRLGFTQGREDGDGEDKVEVWYLPKPEEPNNPLESTLRNTIEDARYELGTIITNIPEVDRVDTKYQPTYPTPSRGDIERALACHDYDKVKGRIETRSTNREEDHPYYASLGAVGDFSDPLILFAYSRQSATDLSNISYYYECIQDLAMGRDSDFLQTQVAILASEGLVSRREAYAAYRYFGIEPAHANAINDDHIIGVFKSRLSDISPSLVEEARKQLRIIGDVRDSALIRAEAADSLETYEQALSWLNLDPGQPDDFVEALYTIKLQDSPGCEETARKAVSIIAEKRNSQRLRHYLKYGTMVEPEMDLGEAYALFQFNDRTSGVSLDVMNTAITYAAPGDVEKLRKAYALIENDQAQNFGNKSNQPNARVNDYPLDTWPVGCRNIGNTCYLNSVLQFLFTIKPLRELILDCDNHMQDPSPEALQGKIVGRVAVTAHRVDIAQKFVRELRTFFEHMITAPTDTVQPAIDLAALALCRTDSPETSQKAPEAEGNVAGLGSIDGMAVVGPTLPPSGNENPPTITPADSVMGDDNDETAKSDTSTKPMDLAADGTSDKPIPPSRPPPIPPRPVAQTKTKLGNIEESARQQDAAEVMTNILDLLSCAFKGEGVLRDGEQDDLMKKLFFSDVTVVRNTPEGVLNLSELRDHFLVSPGGRQRSIYAALDDDFGLGDLENGITKFEYIAKAAPIQIINLRRIQYDRKQGQVYDRVQIDLETTLHLDRYLGETKSLAESQLLELRRAQWKKQKELRVLGEQQKEFQTTEIQGVDLASAVEETGSFLADLAKEAGNAGERLLPTPPPELSDVLHEKAKSLRKELEEISAAMAGLESEIDTIFKDCNDHPYRLHAVFTHRGPPNGGHYWIYIYDFQSNMWRKYNDSSVDAVDEQEIFTQEQTNPPPCSTGVVYIREDLVDMLTQAVKREPANDVEMQDADDDRPPLMEPTVTNIPVLDGVDVE